MNSGMLSIDCYRARCTASTIRHHVRHLSHVVHTHDACPVRDDPRDGGGCSPKPRVYFARRLSSERASTLSMNDLRDVPTSKGQPSELNSPRCASNRKLSATVLPKPIPGSTAICVFFSSRASAKRDSPRQECNYFRDHVIVTGRLLHRLWCPLHVH